MPTPKLTADIITAAIEGFERQKGRINEQIAELRAMLPSGSAPIATPEAPRRKRRKFSAAAIKRMREAQQRRWAKVRGETEPPATSKSEKPKRRISEEGMKRIIAATKKRWALKRATEAAKVKKAGPARKKAGAKKAAVKPASTKTANRPSAKKAAIKRTATTPAPTAPETVAQQETS